MRKTLIINAGSSSLKYKLYEMPEYKELATGIIERIGLDQGIISIKMAGEKYEERQPFPTHEVAIKKMLELFEKFNIVGSLDEITKVGHRVVQGGEIFKKPALIGDVELQQIKDLAKLAPLHNIPNAVGIEVFQSLLPKAQNIAVFDTEFHQTMPEESYIYPVPYEWYTDYHVRKYGMHGTSHKYIASVIGEKLNKNNEDVKVICCHLGNGASVTAIDGGKCIQTSMGLTPLAGIMMGTRSGDIDPSIIQYMNEQTGMSIAEITDILNKKSGMLGISGISSDARDVHDASIEGNKRALLTYKLYATRIIETIGSYYVRLGGLDAIVFTAGLGENDWYIRQLVVEGLSVLGIKLDYEANDSRGEKEISTPDSKVKVLVIPTEEEYQIAKEAELF